MSLSTQNRSFRRCSSQPITWCSTEETKPNTTKANQAQSDYKHVLANISRSYYNTLQCGRNGTAHAAGASILSPARGVFAGMRSVCGRHACGLPLGSATHFHSIAITTEPVHRLQIRPIVHNQGASPTTPPSYIRVRAIVWACGNGQTDTQTRVTTIHFSWSTTHAKCNNTRTKQSKLNHKNTQNAKPKQMDKN